MGIYRVTYDWFILCSCIFTRYFAIYTRNFFALIVFISGLPCQLMWLFLTAWDDPVNTDGNTVYAHSVPYKWLMFFYL